MKNLSRKFCPILVFLGVIFYAANSSSLLRADDIDEETEIEVVDLGFGSIRIAVGGVDIIRPTDAAFSAENLAALDQAIKDKVAALEYQASLIHSAKHPLRSAFEVLTGQGEAAEIDQKEFDALREKIPSLKGLLTTLLTQGPLQMLSEGIKLSSIVLSPTRLLSQDSIAPLRKTFGELSLLTSLGTGAYFSNLVPSIEIAGKTWAILGAGYLVSFTNGDGRTGAMQLLNLPAATRAMLTRPLTILSEAIIKKIMSARWLPFSWMASLNTVILNAVRPRRDALDDMLLSFLDSSVASRNAAVKVQDKVAVRKEQGFVTRIELGGDNYVDLLFRNMEGDSGSIALVKVTAEHKDPLAAIAAVIDQVPSNMRASITRVLERISLVQHQVVSTEGELWPSFVQSVERKTESHLSIEFKSGAVVTSGRRVSRKVHTQGVDKLRKACQTKF